jgi:hypothetical protein
MTAFINHFIEKSKAERLPGIAAMFELVTRRLVTRRTEKELDEIYQAIGNAYLYREEEVDIGVLLAKFIG